MQGELTAEAEMFRIGFCNAWEASEARESFPRLKTLGYEGVEIWQQTLEALPFEEWEEIFAESGIACAQLCPYFNFVDGAELWESSLLLAERYIDYSRRLGAPLIRVFTGIPWGTNTVGPDRATPQQWEAAISGLQHICDMALPHGVRFALECHTGSLMEDSPNTLRLLEGVDRPNLGVNLQLPLKDGREPITQSIEQLGRYTWHMHAHNYRSIRNLGDMCPLEQGVMDYVDILTRLSACGFAGYVSIEHPNHNGTRDPWEIAAIEAEYLQRLRRSLAE